MGVSKNYIITELGLKKGYRSDYFEKDADEIKRHHYNDDFHLYVGSHFKKMTLVGIFVLADDEDTIDWFVKGWVEKGILKEDNQE